MAIHLMVTGIIVLNGKEENLLIYIESTYSIEVTPAGEIVSVQKIIESDTNRSYWYDVQSPGRMVGDTLYRIQNDRGFLLNLFSTSYSQLVSVAPNGETIVILDHKAEHFKKDILNIAFVAFEIIGLTAVAVKKYKEGRHLSKKEQKTFPA